MRWLPFDAAHAVDRIRRSGGRGPAILIALLSERMAPEIRWPEWGVKSGHMADLGFPFDNKVERDIWRFYFALPGGDFAILIKVSS